MVDVTVVLGRLLLFLCFVWDLPGMLWKFARSRSTARAGSRIPLHVWVRGYCFAAHNQALRLGTANAPRWFIEQLVERVIPPSWRSPCGCPDCKVTFEALDRATHCR